MEVGRFDRGGSWRLWPRVDYLADAEDFDDFRSRLTETKDLPARLEDLHRELADAWERERRLRIKIRNGQRRLDRMKDTVDFKFGDAEKREEARSLKEGLDSLRSELTAVLEEIEELKERREELAQFIERNFRAVQTEPRRPDLSAPDEKEVKDRIAIM